MSSSFSNSSSVAKSVPFSNASNGFTAKNVQAAIEEAKGSNTSVTSVSATGTQTSTSTSYANITSMTQTPSAGTYLVVFNGRASTSGASAGGLFGIAVAGSLQTDSIRELSTNLVLLGGLVTISINTVASSVTCVSIVTVNGSQAITAQFRSTTGGSINIAERNLTITKIS